MTIHQPKRLVGRIDKAFETAKGVRWGFLVTEEWIAYAWHSDNVQHSVALEEGDIVGFTPIDSIKEGQKPRAANIELLKREKDAEYFGKFARFFKNRQSEDLPPAA